MTFPLTDCCTRDAHDDAPVPRQQRGVARQCLSPPQKAPSQKKRVRLRKPGDEPHAPALAGQERGLFLNPKPSHLKKRQDFLVHWLQTYSHPLAHWKCACPTRSHQEKKTRSYSLLLFRSWSKDSLHSSTSCEESLEKTKGRKACCPADNTSPALRRRIGALQSSGPVNGRQCKNGDSGTR